MDQGFAMIIIISLISIALISTYFLSKIKSSRLYKYIPTGTLALAILFFYFKLYFISKRFEGIFDMVAIILLAIVFFTSLLFAIILEFVLYNKNK